MNMEREQEKALVERAKTDPDAFGELYDEYYMPIFNYLLRRTANITDTQDLTSEVFMKAFKNIGTFKWSGISFSAWLYRIAFHEIINKYRKGKHEQSFNIDAIDTNSASSGSSLLQVEDETKKYEDYFVIHQSISRLPAKYREVISLRFFAGKEIHEISQILDKPESSIKTLLYRGLEKLRVDIQEPVVVKMKLPR
jgi:RNA polymerase sigma-70 factor (ECF subfamily)